ncbi:transmembrane protein 179-like [Lytechinus variegatus]|uniref:transmembrane protein 179-like n=1 Tax=Lytechinus variegatus TaxID=7654 RepID=UPI001BB16FEA|nr:transmembrane protein 179-like [Lytechinus variegatus]
MGLGNVLLLSQITGYIFGAIFSLFTFPPIAVSQDHFDDHCILFSTGYLNTTLDRYVINEWSLGTQCGFAIYVGIQLMGISLWQSIRLSIHAVNGTDSSFLMTCITLLVNLLMNIMLLASAITVTDGYKVWCAAIKKANQRCEYAGYANNFFFDENIKPAGFNLDWGIAQFGLWTSWILYTILLIFSLVKLSNLHKQENILRSLTRERQRLLGHYEQPDL